MLLLLRSKGRLGISSIWCFGFKIYMLWIVVVTVLLNGPDCLKCHQYIAEAGPVRFQILLIGLVWTGICICHCQGVSRCTTQALARSTPTKLLCTVHAYTCWHKHCKHPVVEHQAGFACLYNTCQAPSCERHTASASVSGSTHCRRPFCKMVVPSLYFCSCTCR